MNVHTIQDEPLSDEEARALRNENAILRGTLQYLYETGLLPWRVRGQVERRLGLS